MVRRGHRSAQDRLALMGLFDKFRSLVAGKPRLDVESRFERLRSSVTGTMSNFQVVRDRQLDRIVGLKLCDKEKVDAFENRFKGLNKPSEGEIAIQMRHPRIVETYEYGLTTKGQPYLIMEYIEGPGLQLLLQNRDELSLHGRRLLFIRQMAEAIQYVHDQGFIHRDICPRNFICLKDLSGVKLIDFGLTVPATPPFMQPGNRTGTPLYMSPEVVRRRPTDQRLDVFSFGVTCYLLCTFEFPWPVAETSGMAALRHDSAPPRPINHYNPDIHPVLGDAIMKCLAADAALRMPSMEAFLRQIRHVPHETVES